MTVTGLHSLASSTTGGWMSAVVDNSSNLWRDAHVFVNLDFANTAAANSKAAILYVYGGVESGVYSGANGATTGSEGGITLTDFTANAQNIHHLGNVFYVTTNETAQGGPFSVARAMGLMSLPKYWGVILMNHSGAALAASGNTVKWLPVYDTVA